MLALSSSPWELWVQFITYIFCLSFNKLLNLVQKCILVSTYSHSHISIPCGTCTLRGQKINSLIKAWSYLHISILPKPLIRTRRTQKNIKICWFTPKRITANQWVFYWTLFSFSKWFFTWASSVSENTRHYLCRHSPWATCLPWV